MDFDLELSLTVVAIFIFIVVLLMLNLMLTGRNRKIKHDSEMVQMNARLDNEVSIAKMEVAENTMNELGRDLHDDVGQQLVFTIMQMNALDKKLNDSDKGALQEARNSVQAALNSIRNISKNLNKDYISLVGFKEGAMRLFDKLSIAGTMALRVDIPEQLKFKSPSNEIFLYRIIQECVSNTIKYAGASTIFLTVRVIDDIVTVVYEDDGQGISNIDSAGNAISGIGINNMKKRAELMKGDISIGNREPHGIKVSLTFPDK
ncbi:MAG TPA: histidine kinase [Bacteroidia bacterium]|jgi:signal transduction histidine kinase|nr:histidine kinase [Bacteroidia bacterium]HQK97013.1 histidine kinase [Bacteroidia bacterium]